MATPQNIPFLEGQDTEIYTAIRGEEKRQEEGLELIPSENYVSRAVMEASGSALTNRCIRRMLMRLLLLVRAAVLS